jgi:hypothetical protein
MPDEHRRLAAPGERLEQRLRPQMLMYVDCDLHGHVGGTEIISGS